MKSRAEMYGLYIVENKSTIRNTAKYFGTSKSSVHNYISKKLKKENINLYILVSEILKKNFNEKHLRGGESTRLKYLNKTQKND